MRRAILLWAFLVAAALTSIILMVQKAVAAELACGGTYIAHVMVATYPSGSIGLEFCVNPDGLQISGGHVFVLGHEGGDGIFRSNFEVQP